MAERIQVPTTAASRRDADQPGAGTREITGGSAKQACALVLGQPHPDSAHGFVKVLVVAGSDDREHGEWLAEEIGQGDLVGGAALLPGKLHRALQAAAVGG